VDTPEALTARLRGAETMYVHVDSGTEEAGPVLATVPGVSRVVASDGRGTAGGFEVESERGTDVRRELARTVVQRGWGLLELRPMRMSLEEIFLQVTTDETDETTEAAEARNDQHS
jgi:ABC-2 type transport system ATP-binding protein